MTRPFEVGQMVTIDSDNYLNSQPGMILDVTASSDNDTMYTVDVEEHGTHYFYGSSLVTTSDEVSDVH